MDDLFDVEEADEEGGGKEAALRRLTAMHKQGETYGVISMYERAALKVGATMDEVEAAAARAVEREE